MSDKAAQKAQAQAKLSEWRDGADGFLLWLKDVKPKVLNSRNQWQVFTPEPFQLEGIRGALARHPNGTWKNQVIAFSYPRRHSKTVLCALLALWRFTLWPNENIVVLANSENQARNTGFGLCRKIVLNTPFLAQQVGRDNVFTNEIRYPALQSSIRLVATNVAALFGEKVSVGWVSEVHAAQNIEGLQVISSSLGDTEGAWLLIDSTVDAEGGPLHSYEKAQADPDIDNVFVHRIEYASLDEALEKSPSWINRKWLQLQHKQLPEMMFGTQHLNRRCDAQGSLFSVADVERCMERLPHPMSMDDLRKLADGRTFATGGGFDRAFLNSKHGDRDIWTAIAKVAREGGEEPEYYVLHQEQVSNHDKYIKKCIAEDYERYSLQNVALESYNMQDVFTWTVDKSITSELIIATQKHQIPAFMHLHRIVREGRLHFSDKLHELAEEMKVFPYEMDGDSPRFGKSRRNHDDRVFSLAWAIYSLRDMELAAFVLNNMVCTSKSPHSRLCYLRTGELVLHCSDMCGSHKSVAGMHLQYTRRNVDSEISLPEFYKRMVKKSGVTLIQ